jgi:hypothetical protein
MSSINKFFIPAANDENQRDKVYDGIKKWATECTGWKIEDKKIYSLRYIHDGKWYEAQVGEPDGLTKEKVIAILKSNAYLICTPNRGVIRDMPILVGPESAYDIKYFDE